MAGLVDYGSSGEEDNVQEEQVQHSTSKDPAKDAPSAVETNGAIPETQQNGNIITARPSLPAEASLTAPLVGPVLGPMIPADLPMDNMIEGEERDDTPQSPYSANRALLRDLTLPTIASYEIPPSPPGSPIASTDAKFKKFLELKKNNVHFNDKLAKSAALKNPSLMQKLMDFADIDEDKQYSTTLPEELWNPSGFPESAFKENLAKNQQKILKRKEEEKSRGQREAVDFVPATASGDSSRSGTPGIARTTQKSAAERVMAGLERGRSNSPHVQQGTKRKTRFES